MKKDNIKTLGVVIGRFQTPYLTEGHKDLIIQASELGSAVLILLGTTSAVGTDRNPLNYSTRVSLMHEELQQLGSIHYIIEELQDNLGSNQDWSNRIDSTIERLGFDQATLLGGRDNSVEGYYCGKHPIKIIDKNAEGSATEIRKQVANSEMISGSSFRRGIIYHIENRYPIVYSTVDVAIMYDGKVLMGRKGDKYSFVGGFVDPQDQTLGDAAFRELQEETGFERGRDVAGLEFLFSCKVEDSRYKGTKDSIMTNFFRGYSMTGELPFSDNISDKEFKDFIWMSLEKESLEIITESHQALFQNLLFIHKHHG